MTTTKRLQLQRIPGYRKPPDARASKHWGNPYPVKEWGWDAAIELYREHLRNSPELVARILT